VERVTAASSERTGESVRLLDQWLANVILAAQAMVLHRSSEDASVVVAADNVRHLSRFATAVSLEKIDPTEERISPSA
jgi:hypothetical protein